MATHKSAEKRHRQSLRRKARNRFTKSTIRTATKTAVEVVSDSDQAVRETAARQAVRLIDKAGSHGILHRNAVRRKISRLQKRLNKIQATA